MDGDPFLMDGDPFLIDLIEGNPLKIDIDGDPFLFQIDLIEGNPFLFLIDLMDGDPLKKIMVEGQTIKIMGIAKPIRGICYISHTHGVVFTWSCI